MNRSTVFSIILFIATYLFMFLFVYAGVRKMLDVETFKLQIGEMVVLKKFATVIAWGLILLQLMTSTLLLLQPTRRLGFYLSFILMTVFTLYIFLVLNFSNYVPCACSGVIPGIGWNAHLYINVALMLLAFFAIILEKKYTSKYLKHTT